MPIRPWPSATGRRPAWSRSTRRTRRESGGCGCTTTPVQPGAALAWDNVVYREPGLGYVVSTHQDIRMSRPERTAFTAYCALSDMAPDTIGVRSADQARSANLFEEALNRAIRLLAPAGSFVGKIFQGPDVDKLRKQVLRTRTGDRKAHQCLVETVQPHRPVLRELLFEPSHVVLLGRR